MPCARLPPIRRQTIIYGLLLLLFALFTVQLVRVARLYSANWDEAHHLLDGYLILTRGDYRANAEVPPLVKMVAALPILHLHPAVPAPIVPSQTENAFLSGRVFVFDNGGDRLLLPARLACMGFALLLAWLVFACGRSMFGTVAGLCALALLVFDPLLLAHGTLISTDVGSACFLLGAVYSFYRTVAGGRWGWLLGTGLLAGLAMVAKFTGVLVAPMLLLLALAEGCRQRDARTAGRWLLAAVGALLCGWVVVWAFYGFRYKAAPAGLALQPKLGPYIASMPQKGAAHLLALAARVRLFPEAYLWGLANTKHTEWEYTSWFLGRLYRHGPWEYFPLAFVVKSTVPLLLLLILAVWLIRGGTWRRHGRELLFLLLPVAVYGLVVVTSHFDIGARHLMPVYPFLYVLAGAVLAVLFERGGGWSAVAGVLLLWQVGTSLWVAPNYMAYGNELIGGPLQVRRYLSDANVDWGQQLKSARQYLDRNHIQNCLFAYFPDGAVEVRDYGLPCKRLPTPSGLWWFNLPMEVPPVISGTVLISESDLDGVESGEGALNPYDGFRKLKPVAILQDGVYVYQGTFAVPLASAWVDVRDSWEAIKAGDTARGLQLAETAATLAPQSARVQLQLANVLSNERRWDEAAAHYRLAQVDMERDRPDLQGKELGPQIVAGLREAAGPH